MKRKHIQLFLLLMALLYQIDFLLRGRQVDLVLGTIYSVGCLTMKED